jgi:hypothetical protein
MVAMPPSVTPTASGQPIASTGQASAAPAPSPGVAKGALLTIPLPGSPAELPASSSTPASVVDLHTPCVTHPRKGVRRGVAGERQDGRIRSAAAAAHTRTGRPACIHQRAAYRRPAPAEAGQPSSGPDRRRRRSVPSSASPPDVNAAAGGVGRVAERRAWPEGSMRCVRISRRARRRRLPTGRLLTRWPAVPSRGGACCAMGSSCSMTVVGSCPAARWCTHRRSPSEVELRAVQQHRRAAAVTAGGQLSCGDVAGRAR